MPAAAAALAAAQAGTLGIGFSGAGFLIPFFLGAIEVLQSAGVLTDAVPVAGASSGALAVLAAGSQLAPAKVLGSVQGMSKYCHKRGNCFGTLQDAITPVTSSLVPATAAKRFLARRAPSYLAVTRPSALGDAPPSVDLIGNFNGREDLLEAAMASAYIPYWSGPSLTTQLRGEEVYDGSLGGPGDGFLPCPPNVTYCVRISAFPPGVSLGSMLLSELGPLSPLQNKALAADALGTTLLGSDLPSRAAATLETLAGAGPIRAAIDAARAGWLAKDLVSLVTPGDGAPWPASIWPGRRHGLPKGRLEWTLGMVVPPSPEDLQAIYDLGKAEARSWAEEEGFLQAQAPAVARRARADGGRKLRGPA